MTWPVAMSSGLRKRGAIAGVTVTVLAVAALIFLLVGRGSDASAQSSLTVNLPPPSNDHIYGSPIARGRPIVVIDAGHGGWMILMSSILGRKAGTGPGVAAYVASKIAVEGLTRELARQWAPHGIRVNALAPGYFPTEMNAPMTRDPGRREALLARTPMGRSGEPEDLVGPALFLAGEASRFVTGHVLPVDGGMACW